MGGSTVWDLIGANVSDQSADLIARGLFESPRFDTSIDLYFRSWVNLKSSTPDLVIFENLLPSGNVSRFIKTRNLFCLVFSSI